MNLVDSISKEISTINQFPKFGTGDTITVYYKIKEGNKERVQAFQGVCIGKKNNGLNSSFSVITFFVVS